MPKVSVIIPVYNTGKYLKDCLDSVVNQTLSDIEIICINDGSTDNSLGILKEYEQKDNRIKVLTQNNQGSGAARNSCVKIAKGAYLYFLDSDDWMHLSCLEKCYNKITQMDADICFLGMIPCNESKEENYISDYFSTKYYETSKKDVFTYKDIKNYALKRFGPPLRMYRTKFFIDNDLFFSENTYCEDVISHNKAILSAQKLTYIKENLTYYRYNPNSTTHSAYTKKKCDDVLLYIKQTEEFLKRKKVFLSMKKPFHYFALEELCAHNSLCEEELKIRYLNNAYNYINNHLNFSLIKKDLLLCTYYVNLFSNINTKQVEECKKRIKKSRQNSFLQNIFSIKNSSDRKHKVITICGIKLNFKSKKLLKRIPSNENSFLEDIFSVKNNLSNNNKWHKIICILGVKFSFRNKKRESNIAQEREKQFIKKSLNNLIIQNNELKQQNTELKNELKIQQESFQKQYCELNNKLEKQYECLKRQNVDLLSNIVNYRDILNWDVRKNSVLLIETNAWHGEVLIGIVKYFRDLKYNVDILLSKDELALNLFKQFEDNNIRIQECTLAIAQSILKNKYFLEQYNYIYINSDLIYDEYSNILYSSAEAFKNIPLPKNKILNMCHKLEDITDEMYLTRRILVINDLPVKYKEAPIIINPHYFGNINFTPKNKITRFIVIGNIDNTCKNHNLLFTALSDILNKKITNFRISVISRVGTLDNISNEFLPYIDFKGKLPYNEVFEEMEKADFFLTLLDPLNPAHDRYITRGTSGSIQLIYGFRKPCLIAKKFAEKYCFNSKNSIVYENNSDFANAMVNAINMDSQNYEAMCESLDIISNNIYSKSLNNLKEILE